MFSNLFGDGRIGGILALLIGLCILGLIVVYAWRAFGRGIRPTANRSARQTRLGIVDAFDLDRHRQLVLVRRDNVEHLIMIGGPNDLLIEEAIVRAQPSGVERREPTGAPAPGQGERPSPRLPVEPSPPNAGVPVSSAPMLDVKPGLEPSVTAPVTPPPLRPTLDSPTGEQAAPPPPLSRPAGLGQRPIPQRPAPPVRPMPAPPSPAAPRPGAPTLAQRPVNAPSVTPPAPPVTPPVASPAMDRAPDFAKEAGKEPATDAPKEPPKLTVNIDSLEEEMAKLLGRPSEPPRS